MAGLPQYALIEGLRLKLLRQVPHVGSGEAVVECVVESGADLEKPVGTVLYATQDQWLEGTQALLAWSREENVVTAASPSADKLRLFRSLFKGRDDVFAHGYRRKDGGIAYTPACANEWQADVCPKADSAKRPGVTCSSCPNRQFEALTDQALIAHFRGNDERFRDVVGLYVLDDGSRTSVLVADFDGPGWQSSTATYRDSARKHGLDAAVERSRSGDGGHAWLFFEEPVDAKLARNLGSCLITSALATTKAMRLDAYDRLFPAQDTLLEGGLGNLIALPFQGRAQRLGNSMFVDDDFVAFRDQWEFLSHIRKVSTEQAKAIVAEQSRGKGGVLGPLSAYATNQKPAGFHAGSSNKQVKARSAIYRRQHPLTSRDFPALLTITQADMLYVPYDELSASAFDSIRRLAAFANPDFYRAQAMHQSVWGKPRVIDASEDRDGCIALPRGCEAALRSLLDESGCAYAVVDDRTCTPNIDARFVGELRPMQQEAADALLQCENGVLAAPTGFGKTVVAAYVIARLKLPTLVIVPKTPLLEQWIAKLGAFLEITETREPLLTPAGRPSRKKRPLIGQIGAGKRSPGGLVDVASFQSLFEGTDVAGLRQVRADITRYGLVICDECHHAAAPQLERVLKAVRACNVYGLSATPKRADGLDPLVHMLCGPTVFNVDARTQAAEQGIVRHLIPRTTAVRFPELESEPTFAQVIDALCNHGLRNRMIADDVLAALREGRTSLVVSKRKAHARKLADLMEEGGADVRLLIGEGSARARREAIANAVRESLEKPLVLVATESYLGEGFDMPNLDALFLATPISWSGNVTQQSGRLHRVSEGKTDVRVYDYVDTAVPMLERMYKKRLKTYVELGYEPFEPPSSDGTAAQSSQIGVPSGSFVDAKRWLPVFMQDIRNATRSIHIVAPYASTNAVGRLSEALEDAVGRGLRVSCVIRQSSRQPEGNGSAPLLNRGPALLEQIGCDVRTDSEGPRGYAVFDERIVWYGGLPLLAFPRPDECSLRFDSPEIAHDMLASEGSGAREPTAAAK